MASFAAVAGLLCSAGQATAQQEGHLTVDAKHPLVLQSTAAGRVGTGRYLRSEDANLLRDIGYGPPW
ncbi:MAG: hypothetical protein KGY81_09815 [Phycisphaerae bacterium]|jgi:hypothetical protein|nr:hypothetical protein [Phycisphaerae bacterium]